MPPEIEGVKLPSFEPKQLRLVGPKLDMASEVGAVMTNDCEKVQGEELLLSFKTRL